MVGTSAITVDVPGSERAARTKVCGALAPAIQKHGRSRFFRAVRCARPPTGLSWSPELMRRGRVAPFGLRDLGFLTSAICVLGGCRQRQLWSASHRGSDSFSASCSGGLTPIFASGRLLAGCAWAWGGDLKPYRLTAVGTFSASVDCWHRYGPSAGVRGQAPADNGPSRGLIRSRASSTWGIHAAKVGGLRARYPIAADYLLGNSVGAIESAARCPGSLGAWVPAAGR